jgi:hypothetical protein
MTARRVSGFRTLLAALALAGVTGVGTAQAHPGHEDEPGWDCTVDGNRVCGPGNANGVAPGCYADGALVTPWPVVNPDGLARVFR